MIPGSFTSRHGSDHSRPKRGGQQDDLPEPSDSSSGDSSDSGQPDEKPAKSKGPPSKGKKAPGKKAPSKRRDASRSSDSETDSGDTSDDSRGKGRKGKKSEQSRDRKSGKCPPSSADCKLDELMATIRRTELAMREQRIAQKEALLEEQTRCIYRQFQQFNEEKTRCEFSLQASFLSQLSNLY